MKKKRGLGDCPQGFDFDFYFPRAISPEANFRVIFAEIRVGARLGPDLFAIFAKRSGRIASFHARRFPFFAKTAKKGKPRRAPALAKNTRETASGEVARKKQSQTPGGNPPDPFFLSIIKPWGYLGSYKNMVINNWQ
ncbi:MAG: hypothetical protein HQL76_17790 [Magnetococcales bacterium]|nr:hypothetical protein [Magnetococcales bacterium]